jgi:hypothetical protein
MPEIAMNVTFGWHYDGRQGPLPESSFMSPVLGRQGLLALLELHLGLAGPPVSRSERVVAYLAHLRKVDDGKRFYSRSLQVDDFGVASKLLDWRDHWLLHGWDAAAAGSAPARVRDMTAVEATACEGVPAGEAERLYAVASALARRSVPVGEVRLIDAFERLPKVWRAVLALLPVRVEERLAGHARSGTSTLAKLQAAARGALNSGSADAIVGAQDDGSVLLMRSESVELASHWLSERQRETAETDLLLVCEQGGLELDDLFRARGGAVCGFDKHSPNRPALQTLPLALEQLWTPVDVHAVLQFLTHPYGPIGRSARWRLARAYAECPGFGGQPWASAKAHIAEQEDGPKQLERVRVWFDGLRWERAEGAPLDAVTQRVEAVAQALRGYAAHPRHDTPAVVRAARQAETVLRALEALKVQGVSKLAARQVEQLLSQATAGAGNPLAEPEVGCLRSAPAAALAIEPSDEVLWWMPSRPSLPSPAPWTNAEVQALEAAGVELPDPESELQDLAQDWLRPLLAARDRFVLVLPPKSSEEHPLSQLVQRLLPSVPVRAIEEEVEASSSVVLVADKPLPRLQREFHVEADMTSRRTRQSYSSLSELFDNPAVAVLKDAAALRTMTVLAVEDERRLLGTLAHRLLELMFAEPDVLGWHEAKVRAWFDAHADGLVAAEGAPLLMPGFSVVLHRFKATARDGAVALLRHLQQAGAVSVKTEVKLEGEIFGVPVVGSVDTLVELPDDRLVALDLKWSGKNRYADRLKTGTHLQLAIYSALVEQRHGRAPSEVGFFIFDGCVLLTTSNAVFPEAQVCAPPEGVTAKAMLAAARASWEWRQDQLAEHRLELVDLRLAGLDEFQGPDGTLPVGESGPWNAEYVALLGWQEGA